jgi:uncharacterized cupin superfamily protein
MSRILVEHNPSPMKLEVMGVEDWPIWTKEVSTFKWSYDQTETCYFLEGEVVVTPDGGNPVQLREGDLVTFLADLSCTWEVRLPVRKHYRLG